MRRDTTAHHIRRRARSVVLQSCVGDRIYLGIPGRPTDLPVGQHRGIVYSTVVDCRLWWF